MRTNREGVGIITTYEGCRLRAYKCPAGRLSIGYGDTENVRPGQVITRAEAEERLARRLEREFEPGVRRLVRQPVSGNEFSALVSFAYNVGLSAFAGSTLLAKLNAGDFPGAADEFGKWIHGGNRVLAGLKARRAAERKLFLTPGDGSPAEGESHV